jgi:hypothetical protein
MPVSLLVGDAETLGYKAYRYYFIIMMEGEKVGT